MAKVQVSRMDAGTRLTRTGAVQTPINLLDRHTSHLPIVHPFPEQLDLRLKVYPKVRQHPLQWSDFWLFQKYLVHFPLAHGGPEGLMV